MQPGSASEPAQPAAGWPPASAPGPASGPAPVPGNAGSAGAPATEELAPPARSRTGLIVLVAVLTELIVIGAADNQYVAERITDHALDHPNSLTADLALSVLTFQWRFTPSAGDRFHALYGQFALLGVLVVATALLVGFACRGRASFGRAFLGAWTGVLAAGVLGAILRGLVVDSRLLPGNTSRLRAALFSGYGPTQYVVFGSLVLGLLVGLAAGITAASVRRSGDDVANPAVVPVTAAASSGPGAYPQSEQYGQAGQYGQYGQGDQYGQSDQYGQGGQYGSSEQFRAPAQPSFYPQSAPYPPPAGYQPGQYQPPAQPRDDASTAAFDRAPADEDATAQFQPMREQPPESGNEQTRQLPAVPDETGSTDESRS